MKRSSLNHVYRVVWNVALQVWQAVSEITKGKTKTNSRGSTKLTTLAQLFAGAGWLLVGGIAFADLPQGGQVAAGSATIESNSNSMIVRQTSDRLAIDWQGYNIGEGNRVEYLQPSNSSVALNRVLGGDPSQIRGSLVANGRVFLVNPNGIVFGERSVVDVAGLVASTLNISNEDFMAGNYTFTGNSAGVIVNQGNVVARPGGFVVMIAAKMENVGRLNAEGGDILLGAGQRVRLDLGGPVAIEVEGPVVDAYINNGGIIQADGGNIVMTVEAADQLASLAINNTGIIQARGIGTGDGGTIRLSGGHGAIANSHIIDASAADGVGGSVELTAAQITLAAGSLIDASGGSAGGEVRLQAPQVNIESQARVDISQTASAPEADTQQPAQRDESAGKFVVQAENVRITQAHIDASGVVSGGSIEIIAAEQTIADSLLDSSGALAAGRISLTAPSRAPEQPQQPPSPTPAPLPAPTTIVVSQSALRADATNGDGGEIAITADDLEFSEHNSLTADGPSAGGNIKIGGGYKGQDNTIANAQRTTLSAETAISASATERGDGGEVIVWADGDTVFAGHIVATGGALGGDGGFAEVSGKGRLAFVGSVDLTAAQGAIGSLLLDPFNLTISASTDANIAGGFDAAGNDSVLNVTTLQNALTGADVTVSTGSSGSQAGDITVADSISWGSASTLTLQAAGSITLDENKSISSFDGGLTLDAGTGVSQGAGSALRLGGAVAVSTVSGDITLDSALNGFIGTISATTGDGDIALANNRELKLGNISAAGVGKGLVTLSTAEDSNASILSSGSLAAVTLIAATDGGGSIALADVDGDLTVESLTAQGNITLGNSDTGTLTLAGNGDSTDEIAVINGKARFEIYGSGTVALTGSNIVINDDIRTEGGNIDFTTTTGAITSAADADIVTSSLASTGTTSGRVRLTAGNGMLVNNITTAGSDNLNGVGANAADVFLTALDGALSVGNIIASGGSAVVNSSADIPANRNGGNAGVIVIEAVGDGADGDDIIFNGNLTTAGGSAVGTSDTGLGGYINIKTAVVLSGDRTISTGSTVGDVEFDSSLDSNGDLAGHGLTISTGTGNVAMHGEIGGVEALDFLNITANSYIHLDESVTLSDSKSGNSKEGLTLSADSVYLGDPSDTGTVTIDTSGGNSTVDINADSTILRESAVFVRGSGGIDFSSDVYSEAAEQNNLTFNGVNGGSVSIGDSLGSSSGRLGDILFSTGTDIIIPDNIYGGSFIALNNTGLIKLASTTGASQDFNRVGGYQLATTGTDSAGDEDIRIYSSINLSADTAPMSISATNGTLTVSSTGASNQRTLNLNNGDATFFADGQLNFNHADLSTGGGDVSLTGSGVYQYGDRYGASEIDAGSGKIRVDGNDGAINLLGTMVTTDADSAGTDAVVIQDAASVQVSRITAASGTLRFGEMIGDVADVVGDIVQSDISYITDIIDIKTLEAFAGGNISITSSANIIDTLGDFSLGGSLAVHAIGRAAGMALIGDITATDVSIRTGNGSLELGSFDITSTAGNIWLQGSGINQASDSVIDSQGTVTVYGNDYRTASPNAYNYSTWINSYRSVDLQGQILAASTDDNSVTFANINSLVLPQMEIGSSGARGGLRIGVDNWNYINGAITQSAATDRALLVSQVSGYTNDAITLDNALNEIDRLGSFQRGGDLTIVDSKDNLTFAGSSWYHFGNSTSDSNVTISTVGLMALGAYDIRGAAVSLEAGSSLAADVAAITSSSGSYLSAGGGVGNLTLNANGSNIVLSGQLDQSDHYQHSSYESFPGVYATNMVAGGEILVVNANDVTLANVYANRSDGKLVLGQSAQAITGTVTTTGEIDLFELSGYIVGESASLTMTNDYIRQLGDITAENGISITNNRTGLVVAGALVADNTDAGIAISTIASGVTLSRYSSGSAAAPVDTRLSSSIGSSMTSGLGGIDLVSYQDIRLNGDSTSTGGITLRADRLYNLADVTTFAETGKITLNGLLTAGDDGIGLNAGYSINQNKDLADGQGAGILATTGALYGMNAAGEAIQNATNFAARKEILLVGENEIAELGSFYLSSIAGDNSPGGDFKLKDVVGGLTLTGSITNEYQNIEITTAGDVLALGTQSITAGNLDLYGKDIKLTGRGITQDSASPGSLNVNGTTVNRGGTIELVGHDGTTETVDSDVLAAEGAGDIQFYGTLATKNDSSSAIIIRGAKDVVLPNIEIVHDGVIKGQLSLGTGSELDEIISGNITQGVGTSLQLADLKVAAGGSVVLANSGNSIEALVSGLAGNNEAIDFDLDLYDKEGGLRLENNVVSAGGVRIKTFVDPDNSSSIVLADNDILADGEVYLQGRGITQTENGDINAQSGQITLDGGGSILSLLGSVETTNAQADALVMQNASTVTLNTINVTEGTLVLGGAEDGLEITESVTQTSSSVVEAQTLAANVGVLTLNRDNKINQLGDITATDTVTIVDDGLAGSPSIDGPDISGLQLVGNFVAGGASQIESTDGSIRLGTSTVTVGETVDDVFTGEALTLEGVGISQTYQPSVDDETASASASFIKSGATTLRGGTGSILLGSAANDFTGQVTPTASGVQVFIRDANDLGLTSLASISDASPNDTSITAIAGKALSLSTGALVTDAGSVDLRSLDGDLATPGSITTDSGNVTLFASGTMALNNGVDSQSGNLSVTGDQITHNSGLLALATGGAGTIDVTATGSDGLFMSTNYKYQSDTGTVTINSAGASDLANIVTNGALVVRSSGAVTQSVSSSSLSAASLDVQATNNADITLDNANNNVATFAASSRNAADDATGSGVIRFTDKQDGLVIDGVATTASAVLTATAGAVTQTSAIDVGALALKGAGSFTLDDSANKLPLIASEATGAVSLSSSVATTIGEVNPSGITTGGANFSLTSTAVTISNAINTGAGLLSLTATAGGITQANGSADITAGNIKLSATGNISLLDSDNDFGALAAVTSAANATVTLVEDDGFDLTEVDGIAGIVTNAGEVSITSSSVGLSTVTAVKTNSAGGVGADITLDGAVLVKQNSSFDAGSSAGDVLFKNSVDSTSEAGPYGLTIYSGAETRFDADVGATTALDYLTTDAAGTVQMAAITVTTANAQTYQDAVVLGGDVTLTSTADTILLNGGVDGDAVDVSSVATGAERSLTINAAAAVNFFGAIGSAPVNDKHKLGTLTVNAAGLSQSDAGVIQVAALAIDATGAVVLTELGNNVGQLAAQITSTTDDQYSLAYTDADGVEIARIGSVAGLSDVEEGEAAGSNFTLNVGGLLSQQNDALIELDGGLTIDASRATQLGDVNFNNTAVGGTELDSSLISGDFTLSSNGDVIQTVVAGTDNDAYLQVGGELTINGGILQEGDSLSNLLGGGATGGTRQDNEIRLNGVITLSMADGKLIGTNGLQTQEVTGADLDDVRVLSLSGGKSITFGGTGGDVVTLGTAANAVKGKLKINTAGSFADSGSSLQTGIRQTSQLSLADAYFEVQSSSLNTTPSLATGVGVINLSDSANSFTGTVGARARDMDIVLTSSSDLALGNITGAKVVLDAATNAITQSGIVSATDLLLNSAGAVTLTGDNRVGSLAAGSVAGLNFTNAQTLVVGSIDGSDGITSSAAVTLTADDMTLDQAITAAGQALTLQTRSASTAINVGLATEAADDFDLEASELAQLTDGFSSITIGNSEAGTIAVAAATFADKLELVSGAGGINISGELSTGSNDLILDTTGAVTQSAAISAAGLGILNASEATLSNTLNDVTTLAADYLTGDLTFVDANTLLIGSVNPTGISCTAGSTCAVDISTLSGDLSVNEDIIASSVVLNAGDATAAGTATGGNITVAEGKSITATSALLYTGSIAGSTNVAALIDAGSGNFRYNGDETTVYSGAAALADIGSYAIYREQPILAVTPGTATSQYGDSPDVAAVTGSYSGYVNGDTQVHAAISGTATFSTDATATSDAGNYNIAYVDGLLSAIGYGFADATSSTTEYTVAKRVISLDGSRVYDGGITADATVLTTLGNLVEGQTLTLTGTGTLTDKNVAADKTVTLGSLVLGDAASGAGLASNYTLEGGSHTLTVTQREISASGITAQSKGYDGNTSATLVTGGAGFAGLIEGDAVAVSGSGTFADKNVGSDISVTVSGLSLEGADAGNYNLTGSTDTLSADITRREVTLSAAREYDGTVALSGADVTFGNLVDGETLNYSGAKASNANVVVADNYIVEITLADGDGATASSGGLASNYALPTALNATTAPVVISAKALTASLAAQSKVYDGNSLALINTADYGLSGFVSGEGATITETEGLFNSKDVTAANSVTVTLAAGDFDALDGTDLRNYLLPTQVINSASTITPKALTLTLNGLSKVYDGNASYALAAEDYALSGFVLSEGASLSGATALFNAANVWEANTASLEVTAANFVADTASGTELSNYSLPSMAQLATDGSYTITAKTVGLAASKVYDGTIDLTGAVVVTTGIAGETLNYSGAEASDANVATADKYITAITLADGSGDARNYQLPTLNASNAAVTINPYVVSATGSRFYNGTAQAAAADLTLGSLVGAQTLGLTGAGSLADKHVGDDKAVDASGLMLADGDNGGLASNYTLAGGSHTLSVTPASLVITSSDVVKTYDATTSAAGSALVDASSGTQLFADDSLSGGSFAFDTKHVSRGADLAVLSNKTVTVNGVTVSDGNSGNNYTVSYSDNTTSTINPALVTVVGLVAQDKVYDGTNRADLTAASAALTGLFDGDEVTPSRATGTFADKNVSYADDDINGAIVAKLVTADTIYLEGADAANYNMVPVTGLSAKITPLGIIPAVTAEDRVYDGSTTATVAASLELPVVGDDVEITYSSANFVDASVGLNKFVLAEGIAMVGGADRGNYTLLSSSASDYADITPRELTISADDQSRLYGTADPVFTFTQIGLAEGDAITVNFDTARGPGLAVGDYAIQPYGFESQNYRVTYLPGTLTITAAGAPLDYAIERTQATGPAPSSNQPNANGGTNTPLSDSFIGGQFRAERRSVDALQLINISPSALDMDAVATTEQALDMAVAQLVTSVRHSEQTKVLLVDGGINMDEQ